MQIYTYYWKIEHFAAKLKSNMSTFHSPNFSISGLYLRVTATLNHLGRDYLLLQLEQVTMDPALDKSNIILRTGDMFKKIQTKLSFKHKIVILDQVRCMPNPFEFSVNLIFILLLVYHAQRWLQPAIWYLKNLKIQAKDF